MKENNKCGLCNICFPTQADLDHHRNTEHDCSTSDEEGGGPSNGYGCGDCSSRFTSFQKLCEHMEAEHSEPLNLYLNEGDSENEQFNQSVRTVYNHEALSDEEEEEESGRFNMSVRTVYNLETMSETEEMEEDNNEQFNMSVRTLYNLEPSSESEEENENEPPNANVVPELQKEPNCDVSKSTDSNGYDCDICKKKFKNIHSFKNHTFVHTGVMCSKCKSTFKSNSLLEKHVKVNFNACNKACTVRKFLSDAVQTKLDCQSCKLNFSNTIDHQVHHLREHGTDPVYKCTLCDFHKMRDNCTRRDFINHIFNRHIPKTNTARPDQVVNEPAVTVDHPQHVSMITELNREPISQQEENNISVMTPASNTDGNYCEICDRTFALKSQFTNHGRRHTGPMCSRCQSTFNNSSHLAKHLAENPETCNKTYKVRELLSETDENKECKFCQKTFSNSLDIQVHQLRVHGKDPVFMCTLCDIHKYNDHLNKSNMVNHMFNMHMKKNTPQVMQEGGSENETHVMNDQQQQIPQPEAEQCENEPLNASIRAKQYQEPRPGQEEDNIYGYKCEICDRTFKHKYLLVSHNQRHTGPICSKCKSTFANSSHLAKHVAQNPHTCNTTHKVRDLLSEMDVYKECEFCKKTFSNSFDIKIHQLRVHGKDPVFKCTLCDVHKNNDHVKKYDMVKHVFNMHIKKKTAQSTSFLPQSEMEEGIEENEPSNTMITTEYYLKPRPQLEEDNLNVVNTTTNIDGYKCEICDRTFKHQYLLVNHNHRHTGPMCSKCKSTFANSSLLEKHTKQKPKICNKTYKVRQMLSETAEEGSNCKSCKLNFGNSIDLKIHQLRVHGIEPMFKCTLCGIHDDKDQVQKKDMISHMFNKHINHSNDNRPLVQPENNFENIVLVQPTPKDNTRDKSILPQEEPENQQKCKIGPKSFATEFGLTHTIPFECSKCNIVLGNEHAFAEHQRKPPPFCDSMLEVKTFLIALKEKELTCKDCSFNFNNRIDFQYHNRRTHGKKHEWYCCLCDKMLNERPADFRTHMLKIHIKKRKGESGTPPKVHTMSKNNTIPMRSRNNINANPDSSLCQSRQQRSLRTARAAKNSITACSPKATSECPKKNNQSARPQKSRSVSNINGGLEDANKCSEYVPTNNPVSQDIGFKCYYCSAPRVFPSAANLIAHYNMVHKKQIPCPNCDHRFPSLGQLRQHIQAEMPYCLQYKKLVQSYLEHNPAGEHKVKCHKCLAMFRTLSDLEQHQMNNHSIIPVYWCKQCNWQYTRKLDFLTHMKENHTEKENVKRKQQKHMEPECSAKKRKLDSTLNKSSNNPLGEVRPASNKYLNTDQACPSCNGNQCQEYSFWTPLPGEKYVACRFPSCRNSKLSTEEPALKTEHINVYHSDQIPDASCLDCGIYFGGPCARINLQKHTKELHSSRTTGMFGCEHCTFETYNKIEAVNHMREEHPERLGK